MYRNYLRGGVEMTITIYLSKICRGITPQWEVQTIDLTNIAYISIETCTLQ